MIDRYSLNATVLKIAQFIAPDELLSATDAQRSVRDTIVHVASSPSITPVQMALIAAELADRIDKDQA